MPDTPDFQYITTLPELEACCSALSGRPWVALDTEFIREKTYRPVLCLLQIKSGDILAIIDTLQVTDLAPLSALLHDPSITKVLHAASQDLEIFYWLDKAVPMPVFDTQIAAPLLGYNDQIGYGNLVKEMLGVELSKAHTRADWSRRPLPENQLRYALDDVIYLEKVYLAQLKALKEKHRLDWLASDFAALTQVDRYNRPARDMWKKMRAAHKLSGGSLAVLQALAEWRELQARESNLPRNWLIKDDVLADIARQMPDSVEELGHIRGLGSRVRNRFAERLVTLIRAARTQEPEPLPRLARKTRITPDQNAIVDILSAYVNQRAGELDINPTLLASRKMLELCLISGDTSSLTGWRQPLLGKQIQSLLDGRSAISIREQKLFIATLD